MSLSKKSRIRSCSMSDLQVNLERMIRVHNFPLLTSSKPNVIEPTTIEQSPSLLASKKESIKAEKCSEQAAEAKRNGTAKSSSNLYPPVFPSLALMNQFKTWTIGRKLKGKLKKMTSRSSNATPAEQDHSVQQPDNAAHSQLPNNVAPDERERDGSVASDLASGGSDSTHEPPEPTTPWHSTTTRYSSSAPTDLERCVIASSCLSWHGFNLRLWRSCLSLLQSHRMLAGRGAR